MAVTIGSVTEGNANAEEIKNNSPDSELYENNKKYLQGSLVKFNDKIYLAKRNVPSDVDLDNPYYWEIFMDAADSKRVDELFEKTGKLDELETESKDNLVAAINEVGSIQPDWAQNDETAKDYIKNRTHWVEEKAVLEETTFTIEESDGMCALGNFPATLSAGDICTVVYDGKTYTCTVFEFETDIAGIGCDAFEIAFQNQPDGLCAITIMSYAGEHTISILQTTYHTLNPKYIKDMYYSEIGEGVIGTGANGWIKVTNYQAITIPKMAINGTIYENVPVDHVANRYVYYVVGGHTLEFDKMSSSMNADGLSDDDVVFYGETQIYHTIPDEFIPWEESPTADSILYTAQSLTEEQQAQARANIGADISTKMDANNPVGTGSFSMNRKAGTVVGAKSHAEGYSTTASGEGSHAEGYGTTASQSYSHAEGYNTTASGFSSHAEGLVTTASGYDSHAEGYLNTASGQYSHTEGYQTIASGNGSHAEGYLTTASGQYSHAEGNYTKASGSSSHAEGNNTTASGDHSHAEGTGTNKFSSVVTTTNPTTDSIITAWKSKKFSVAKGNYSHVEGKDNLALNDYSHAEGYQTTASGENSHAEGYRTIASKNYSHAEGNQTTASGQYSHAEGNYTKASGNGSHAEGVGTTASGYDSHTEGGYTKAPGSDSHAEGTQTTASGSSSHAEGYLTTASGNYSHVQGKYNIKDSSNTYADIIGNGTSTQSSNAATVDWSGNAWFAGDVYTGSTSGTNKDDGSKKLATEEYVNSSIAAGGTDISLGLTSASVGQIIKVKAIDASGKPTAWEAVDMPSGGGSNGGIHLIARVVTEANAASIEVTGLSTTAEVLSLRIYNPGSTCGGGLCITVNGIRKLGYGGTISGTNTVQAFVRAWLYRDGGTLYGRSRMANEGTNVYEWPEMGEITSITVDSTYNDGTTKYFQAGTIFEIYEGMYPNVQ